jgi:CBS domain containing-hemolysin-like protein
MGAHNLNYLAILVSGIAIFMLGGLWYSRLLFAKPWVRLMGKSEEELRAASGNMAVSFATVFLCGLVTAYCLALVLHHFAPLTVGRAVHLSLICWMGFAAATSFGTALFSGTPRLLWLLNSAYNLVAFVIAAIILTLWR